MKAFGSRRGFTLVELLIVVAIIGVLVALLLAGVQSVRETARRTQCANNTKQIGLAANSYHAANNHFPTGAHNSWRRINAANVKINNPGTPFYDWLLHLLPFVEMEPLYSKLQLILDQQRPQDLAPYNFPDEGYEIDHHTGQPRVPKVRNIELQLTPIPLYTCPSMPGFPMLAFCCDAIPFAVLGADDVAAVSYSAISTHVAGADQNAAWDIVDGTPNKNASGVISCQSRTPLGDVVDGASNTLLFTEVFQNYDETAKQGFRDWHWKNEGTPADLICPVGRCNLAPGWGFGAQTTTFFGINRRASVSSVMGHTWASINSFHRGGAVFGMVDGSVRFIADTIPLEVLQTLGTRKPGLFSGELTLGNEHF